jgi:hypothetical protein
MIDLAVGAGRSISSRWARLGLGFVTQEGFAFIIKDFEFHEDTGFVIHPEFCVETEELIDGLERAGTGLKFWFRAGFAAQAVITMAINKNRGSSAADKGTG